MDTAPTYCSYSDGGMIRFMVQPGASFYIGAAWPASVMSNAWCSAGAASYVALTLVSSADLTRLSGAITAVYPGFDQTQPGASGCFGDQTNWTNTGTTPLEVSVQQKCMFALTPDGKCYGMIATDAVPPSPPPPGPPALRLSNCYRSFCCAIAQIDTATCRVLADLYLRPQAGGSSTWLVTSGWSWAADAQPIDFCTFYGVACDEAGMLTSLALRGNGLQGVISSATMNNTLDMLTSLVSLDLGVNSLTAVPAPLPASLTSLLLDDNAIAGPMPPSLQVLTSLVALSFSDNQLTSSIPVFTAGLTALQELRLDGNFISGSVPALVGALTQLRVLDLRNNLLSGALPDLTQLAALTSLLLSGNPLGSPLPALNAPSLQVLQLNSSQFLGPFPGAYTSALPSLRALDVHNNALSGGIPSLLNLTALTYADLSNCGLSGAVPDVPASIAFVNISYNAFTGSLPAATWAAVCSAGLADVFPQQEYALGITLVGLQRTALTTASALDVAFANPCVTGISTSANITLSSQVSLQRRMVALQSNCDGVACWLVAAAGARHFMLNESYLLLSGIYVTGGNPVSGGGGAVYADALSFVAVMNATIAGGQAPFGGGIATAGAAVSLVNATIAGNFATTGDGGAVGVASGWRAVVVAAGSLFQDNQAAASGGALFGNAFQVQACIFQNNSALGGGGGAMSLPDTEWLAVDSSTFSANTCTDSGGAIQASQPPGTNASVASTLFRENSALHGGALALLGGGGELRECIFASNDADASAGAGGAVLLEEATQVRVSGSSFDANAASRGGAVAVICDGVPACTSSVYAFVDTQFTRNVAQMSAGAAILMESGSAQLAAVNSGFSWNVARTAGGAVASDALTLSNCTLDSNRALDAGGGAVYASGSNGVSVSASIFRNNSCAGNGGALLADYDGAAPVSIAATNFSVNAASNGGALALAGVNATLAGCFCMRNEADYVSGHGGGVWVSTSQIDLESTSFINNTAAHGGGVSLLHPDAMCAGQARLHATVFSGNVAGVRGGGVSADGCELLVLDSLFVNNLALGYNAHGAALYFDDSSQAALNVTLSNVVLNGSSVVLTTPPSEPGTQFSIVYGQGHGGGLYMLALYGCALLSVSHTSFVANNASAAAGMYLDGCISAALTDSTVELNTALGAGGGLMATRNVTAMLLQSTFSANKATTGAAVSLHSMSARMSIHSCLFAFNVAVYGAVLALQVLTSSPPALELASVTAHDNVASGAGAFAFTDAMSYFPPPICDECDIGSNVPAGPLFVSAPRTYNASALIISGQSNLKLPRIQVYLWDIFGQIVPEWSVSVTMASQAAAGLTGVTAVAYAASAASFESLVVSGQIGSVFNLSYTLSSASLPALSGSAQAAPNRAVDGNGDAVVVTLTQCGSLQEFLQLTLSCECRAGTFLKADVGECQVCPVGTSAPAARSAACTVCASGSYSSADSTACIQCPAGTFLNSSVQACQACPPGTNSPTASAVSCTRNPAGFTSVMQTSFASSVTLLGISASSFANAPNISLALAQSLAATLEVPADTVSITSISEAADALRRALLAADSASAVLAFSVTTTSTADASGVHAALHAETAPFAAALLQELRASPDPVLSAVSDLTVSAATESVLALASEACAAGTYLDAVLQACLPCGVGSVTTVVGSTACEPCPANYAWLNTSACAACPENSRTSPVNPAQCACNVGYYDMLYGASLTAPECNVCQLGGVCTNGFIAAEEDFWRESVLSDAFYKCRVGNCLRENITGPLDSDYTGVLPADAPVAAHRRRLVQSSTVVADDTTTPLNATLYAPTNCVEGAHDIPRVVACATAAKSVCLVQARVLTHPP
jgi:predicted outer membrane repeat protein